MVYIGAMQNVSEKKIPLGACLVVLVGPSGAGKSTLAKKHFSPSEIVSADDLREWFTGDKRRQDITDVAFDELFRRIQVRLTHGLRVVADATHIRDADRRHTAMVGKELGVPVCYLVYNRSLAAKVASGGWRNSERIGDHTVIEAHETTFLANEKKILRGDSIADLVVDARKDKFSVVKPLDRSVDLKNHDQFPLADIWERGYRGITVVGDIHGNLIGMRQAVTHAQEKNHFIVLLGDIVDYGVDTLRTMAYANQLIGDGRAISLMGNHEVKIRKIILKERGHGFNGRLSEGNAVTLNQLKSMDVDRRLAWENMFLGACATMPHHIIMGDYLFVHGAATDYMWNETIFRFPEESHALSFAMYGETTGEFIDGYPERIYNWVDLIPPRKTVVVGHAVRDDKEPMVVKGAAGGTAVFLDTGSSKTGEGEHQHPYGHLSWMDLTLEKPKKAGYRLVDPVFHREG